jgi:hypothetical protein
MFYGRLCIYDGDVKADELLMVLVMSGVALTCIYLVDECLSWQSLKAFNLKAMLDLRELYRKVHSTTKPYVTRAMRRK